jgi:hypothetical protein
LVCQLVGCHIKSFQSSYTCIPYPENSKSAKHIYDCFTKKKKRKKKNHDITLQKLYSLDVRASSKVVMLMFFTIFAICEYCDVLSIIVDHIKSEH